jgi:hypothetical protein
MYQVFVDLNLSQALTHLDRKYKLVHVLFHCVVFI